jgi:hypothetical protein
MVIVMARSRAGSAFRIAAFGACSGFMHVSALRLLAHHMWTLPRDSAQTRYQA